MYSPFSRIALFLVAIGGWTVLFFGGWIAVRGVIFYARDPVLMGTGGGLAIGGLLVVALTIGAGAQVSTARDTHAIRKLMESGKRPTSHAASLSAPARDVTAGQPPAAPRKGAPVPEQKAPSKGGLRAEPRIARPKS